MHAIIAPYSRRDRPTECTGPSMNAAQDSVAIERVHQVPGVGCPGKAADAAAGVIA